MLLTAELTHLCIGIVSELDPETPGRVRVTFPHLQNVESDWCSVVSPMAGMNRGFVMLPETEDHVLVGFEHGDPLKGYILGAVWNQTVSIPAGAGQPADNNQRFIRSRSGHLLTFDDTPDNERIEIVDQSGKHRVVVDSADNSISVESQEGTVNVLAPGGTVAVECQEAGVKAEKLTVEAMELTIKASGSISIAADGALTLKGATVNIN